MTRDPRRVARWLSLLLGVGLLIASARSEAKQKDDWDDDKAKVELHGFVEALTSTRFLSDPTTKDDFLVGEARFRLDLSYDGDKAGFAIKADLIADALGREIGLDLRQAQVTFQPWGWLSVKAGRQVLTWGTGDLLFLNDLFPKDFVSFFSGRADEYLKAPSNAVRLTITNRVINLDLVWIPLFEPDRFITGERLSFYHPQANQLVGGSRLIVDRRPSRALKNSEGAIRLYRRFSSWEVALYGFIGFYKQPSVQSQGGTSLGYARLAAYGLSVRGPLLGGILNLEGAYYDSLSDQGGIAVDAPNSQVRGLIGYEHTLAKKLTLGVQYYLEVTLQHGRVKSAAPIADLAPPKLRHIVTARLTWQLLRDDLTLSVVGMLGISDDELDGYVRPSVTYKVTDALQLSFGGNAMFGKSHTFFGQLRKNANLYASARYSF